MYAFRSDLPGAVGPGRLADRDRELAGLRLHSPDPRLDRQDQVLSVPQLHEDADSIHGSD